MRAMIFAAGYGTRLKPFTDFHPKALAPLDGDAMLGIVIKNLRRYGVDEVVINVHHFGNQIIEYLREHHNFGIDIHISDETDRLLDTGGGVLAAERWLGRDGEPFIVHNVDVLTDVDFSEMVRYASRSQSIATLLVAERDTSRYLLFDDSGRMMGWTNVATASFRPESIARAESLRRLAFGGVHVISPDIFPLLRTYAANLADMQSLPADMIPTFSITDFYIDACGNHPVYGFMPAGDFSWFDVGRPSSLLEAERCYRTMKRY